MIAYVDASVLLRILLGQRESLAEWGDIRRCVTSALTEVECLGSCGTAPVMLVNDEFHENLDPEKVDRILEKLKAGSNG